MKKEQGADCYLTFIFMINYIKMGKIFVLYLNAGLCKD